MNFKCKKNESNIDKSFLMGLKDQSIDSLTKHNFTVNPKNELEVSSRINTFPIDFISPINSVSNLRFKFEDFERKEPSSEEEQLENEEIENEANVNNSLNFVNKLIDED